MRAANDPGRYYVWAIKKLCFILSFLSPIMVSSLKCSTNSFFVAVAGDFEGKIVE
jgi:hypothetical protein